MGWWIKFMKEIEDKKVFEEKLVKYFPNLYINMYGDYTKTCLSHGLQCGPGWYGIIWELSEKIQQIVQTLPEEDRKNFTVAQVKQKFGLLRFVIDDWNEDIRALIKEYELKSLTICEECGQAGIQRNKSNWLYVSCEKHK
jgi:hypothetical protein